MDGEIIKMVIEFIFLKCKITAYSDYNHKIKRCLLLGRKAMEIPGSILKQRYYLADKGSSSQSYSFPSSHVECESWTIKKVSAEECLPLDCGFGEELLRVPFTVGRSNQSILKEINPGYSLEGLMLKLQLQYFGHRIQRGDSLEKTLMVGKIQGQRIRGQQRTRWLDGITIRWTWV